jgi:phospholipid/cholesterol/gamma-HCH transport system substrate-binding protein
MPTWIRDRSRPLSIVLAIVIVLVAGGITYVVLTSTKMKHATIYFPSTIGIYQGSSVRVLGVQIGKVDTVTPEGTAVRVTVSYTASTKLPAAVGMAEVSPSIVSDRYLQFTPGYTGGAVLADHATIQEDKTEVPVELDQIFGSINDLDVALGPNGANKNGALSQLVNVAADNLKGNGAQFNATLKGFSLAVTALSDSRDQLFGTVTSLQKFTTTLADDNAGVKTINGQLAQVTGQLAGERQDLGAALANLASALSQVQTFVADNSGTLTHDVGALTSITSGLVGEQQALKEITDEAPVALHNLGLSFDPSADTCTNASTSTSCYGALSTRTDNLSDPSALLCSVVSGLLGTLSSTLESTIAGACTTLTGSLPALPTLPSTSRAKTTTTSPSPTPAPTATQSGGISLPTPSLGLPSTLPSIPIVGGLLGGSGTSGSSSSGGLVGGVGGILLGGL